MATRENHDMHRTNQLASGANPTNIATVIPDVRVNHVGEIRSLLEFSGDLYGGAAWSRLVKYNSTTGNWDFIGYHVYYQASTISFTYIGYESSRLNDSASGFVSAGFKVGMQVHINGAANRNNNDWATITVLTASQMNVDFSCVNESAGNTITLDGGWGQINAMVEFGSKIYCATRLGYLLSWPGSGNVLSQEAPVLNNQQLMCMTVFNSKIYAGTYASSNGGRLYEWDGVSAWSEVAPTLNSQNYICSLLEFDGKLYGGTGPNGRLFEWNGTDAWVEKASYLSPNYYIRDLYEYNSKLYGIYYDLLEWNGSNAWVYRGDHTYGVGHRLLTQNIWASIGEKLISMAYNTEVLTEYDGAGAYRGIEHVPRSVETGVSYDRMTDLAVFDGDLYIAGEWLMKFDNTNNIIKPAVTPWNQCIYMPYVYPNTTYGILSLCVEGGELYFTTTGFGVLYSYDGTDVEWHTHVRANLVSGAGYLYSSYSVWTGQLVFLGSYAYTIFNILTFDQGYRSVIRWIAPEGEFELINQPAADHHIRTICVYNSKIYAAGDNGQLYEWSGSAWSSVASQVSDLSVYKLLVFNSKIYGGCGDSSGDGVLLEWNGTDAWLQKAPAYYDGSVYGYKIAGMGEYSGELYAYCYVSGHTQKCWLLKWNGSNAWVLISELTWDLYNYTSNNMVEYDSKLWFTLNGQGLSGLDRDYLVSYDGTNLKYYNFKCGESVYMRADVHEVDNDTYYASSGSYPWNDASEKQGTLSESIWADTHNHARPEMNSMPGYKLSEHLIEPPNHNLRLAARGQDFRWYFKLTTTWDNASPQPYCHAGYAMTFYINGVQLLNPSFRQVGFGWFYVDVPASSMGEAVVILKVSNHFCQVEDVVYTF